MKEITNTKKADLFNMLRISGQEFGIRKASYKHQIKSGSISEEEAKRVISIMDNVYFLLKELYENAHESKNLQF
mgnify:CR=1 FL=1